MEKMFIILAAVLFASLTAQAQSLFIIGEKSYPCTNAIVLMSNSQNDEDLKVFIAKNGNAGLFGVSTISRIGKLFADKIIIYLEDGSVLTCSENTAPEWVDDRTLALYTLTDDQLNKLKSSNIHTVKYTLSFFSELKYSASNKGIETKVIIREFFAE